MEKEYEHLSGKIVATLGHIPAPIMAISVAKKPRRTKIKRWKSRSKILNCISIHKRNKIVNNTIPTK